MKANRWACSVAPAWTFILGLLVGVLPGGLTNPANLLALGLYLCTLLVLVPLWLFLRWLERESDKQQ